MRLNNKQYNKKKIKGPVKSFTLEVTVSALEIGSYVSAYRDTSSPEYAALQSQVVGELSNAYSAANGFSNVQIVEFWQDGENTVAW